MFDPFKSDNFVVVFSAFILVAIALFVPLVAALVLFPNQPSIALWYVLLLTGSRVGYYMFKGV